MAPLKKRVKIANKERRAKIDEKKKWSIDGQFRAHKKLNDGKKRIAERQARRDELQKRMEAASEEEAQAMKMEIDTLEGQLEEDEKEVQDAEAEEAKFKKEEEDADNEDVDDEMEVDDENDPDIPLPSTETETETEIDPIDIVEKLMEGVRLSDPAEITDVTKDTLLRHTQKVTCYKDGFGRPAIVVDCEIPRWIIYRIRKDVMIPESCPNLIAWRRAGKVKDPTTRKKWSVDDISKVQGIAIEVPPGYDKEPEELVKLIPKLSGAEKDKLKKRGKSIPKQPDVQLLIEWKAGMMVEDETGKPKERFTSWESRSGCRTLWKKHLIADAFLLEVAIKREGGYRNAGGRHSTEVRSMSPIDIPKAGSTPGPDDKEEATENELTETEETSDEKEEERKRMKKADERKQREEKEKKEKEEKEKEEKGKEEKEKEKEEKEKKDEPASSASAYKTSLKAFEPKFRMLEDIEADAKLTAQQKGEMIEAFDAYWAKKQAK